MIKIFIFWLLALFISSARLSTVSAFISENSQSILATDKRPSVAIIGAGAAGSSAAYHLANFSSDTVDIKIFESSGLIGGRAQTIELDGVVLETGASIYSDLNSILVDAVKEFNLTTRSQLSQISDNFTDDFELGVWDGEKFQFELKDGNSLSIYWQMIRRFGFKAPYYSNKLNNNAISQFKRLYDDQFPWKNLGDSAINAGLEIYLNTSIETLLDDYGVYSDYVKIFIQSLTRVNYSINTPDIHALAAFVCLTAAKDGVAQVQDGNWKIFERMIQKSKAEVHLNTTVNSVIFDIESKTWTINGLEQFDYVILATPYQLSGITIYPDVSIPSVEYVELYSIHVLTDKPLDASARFNSPNSYASIVTIPWENNSDDASLYTSTSHIAITESGYHVYKIFAFRSLSNEEISSLFGSANVLETVIKRWYSYPKMVPYTDKLEFPDTKLADALYYTSMIEPLISTMETSALSGKNAAKLIWDDIRRSETV